MKFDPQNPPRTFTVGFGPTITMKDCGRLHLDPDEQVTCLTESGGEYDVVRKDWGFYATPSLNGRLARFGLRGVLVLNRLGHLFVLLVEKGREDSFDRYRADEGLSIVHWLDDAAQVEHLLARLGTGGPACPICGGALEPALRYDAPPPGETRFERHGAAYGREYRRCRSCGHFLSVHGMDLSGLYGGAYVDATYGSPEGMRRTFDRVTGLPPERSDNQGRVRRIVDFAATGLSTGAAVPRLLDVGAGLGIFPWGVTRAGWECVALDPDPRAAEHIRQAVGCAAVVGDFTAMSFDGLGLFDVITFNKVLEHVADPVAMLARARPLLRPGGFVYVELPDVAAVHDPDGQNREEFFIEHIHVFSPGSICGLVERAGFAPVRLERLREPSGKYTVYVFATLADSTVRP